MNELSAARTARLLARVGVDSCGEPATALGRGHIHRTYLVRCPAGPVVLQQINLSVFPDLHALASNTDRVVAALAAAASRGEYPLELPESIRGDRSQASFLASGEAWRVLRYIEGGYALDRIDGALRARRGSEAFGRFCAALTGLDPSVMVELIPRFHDLGHRLDQLAQAVGRDARGRLAATRREVDFCLERRSLARQISGAQAALPRRVCHNDTKIDNILFDRHDHRVRAVIDLDTCMPGWWMHDFGDIVRSFCSPEPEDSKHLERVAIRDEIFAAVSLGFTSPLRAHLNAEERAGLWLGALGICLTVGVRFLTDHLDGDRYFGASREGQNLDRARNQLALYRDLASRENALRPALDR